MWSKQNSPAGANGGDFQNTTTSKIANSSTTSNNPARQRVEQLLSIALDSTRAGASDDQIAVSVERARTILKNQPKPLPSGQTMDEIWREMELVEPGIPAHSALRGVGPVIEYVPGLSIVAAPTSSGKTTFLISQVAEWLADPTQNAKILLWSSETSREKIWARILAQFAKRTLWDVLDEVRRGSAHGGAVSADLDAARRFYARVSDRLIIMDETTTAIELIDVARRLNEEPEGLYAVVIDYIQELPAVPDGHRWADRLSRSRELEVGVIARWLREFGNTCKIPVLVAAQFNRQISKNNGFVPDLMSLRESGRLEQNATMVLGLRNETMAGAVLTSRNNSGIANPKTYQMWDQDELQSGQQGGMLSVRFEHDDEWILLEAFVLKNRERGGVGTVIPMSFQPAWGRIEKLNARITVFGEKTKTTNGGHVDGQKTNNSQGEDEEIPDWLR